MRHATDSDHVVAVTTIATSERSILRAMRIGAAWGLGHSATLFLVGGAIVLFRLTIPPRVGLGIRAPRRTDVDRSGRDHAEPARSDVPARHRWPAARVGFVHGLAGSAFVALLVLAAIPGWVSQLAYLALFGIGTIAGMALITAAIAVPATIGARRFARMRSGLRLASGVASIAFGLVLAHRVGFVDGLFTATPTWVPRWKRRLRG